MSVSYANDFPCYFIVGYVRLSVLPTVLQVPGNVIAVSDCDLIYFNCFHVLFILENCYYRQSDYDCYDKQGNKARKQGFRYCKGYPRPN